MYSHEALDAGYQTQSSGTRAADSQHAATGFIRRPISRAARLLRLVATGKYTAGNTFVHAQRYADSTERD